MEEKIFKVEKKQALCIPWGTPAFRIFILSAWMLFLELFLIRWVSTEIRIFAYVNNLVLLACFIGIGLGCYFANREIDLLFIWAFLCILILMVKATPFIRITDLLGGFSNSNIWDLTIDKSISPVLAGISLTIFMFFVVAAVFFPLGQMLGVMLNSYRGTIAAYSLNVFGSIVGIWIFSVLSLCYTQPWVWFLAAVCLGVLFLYKTEILYFLLLAIFSFIVIFPYKTSLFTLWSPYQKLDVFESHLKNGYNIVVNNTGYMTIFDISEDFTNNNLPDLKEIRKLNQYEIPYMFNKKVDSVLIVGAGGGNDAAGALRQGAKSVDAVEIDPGIYSLGKLLHPELPYQDKRVNIYIDDARSFFKKTNKKYDVICFGLLDAHTGSSNYNNIRLDHYVYTLESFKDAKKLLKEDGIMTIIFEANRDWIGPRIFRLFQKTFGKDPLVFSIRTPANLFGWGGLMFVTGAGDIDVRASLGDNKALESFIDANKVNLKNYPVSLTTDDWPYLYLKNNTIPPTVACILISLMIVFLMGARVLFVEARKINLHFLFLGAAFMLLEFQNITKSSLLFGSTWLVNVFTITAILLLILLANLTDYYSKIKNINFFYLGICLSLIVLYLLPISRINIQNYYLKAVLMGIFLNIPIFFAGIIFIHSFKNFPHKNLALGSNLLGACIGGLLESVSFVSGIKALLIFVFIFYILSYCFRVKQPSS